MQDEHQYWMKRCFELAQAAESRGESPVGSLLVRNGELLSQAAESSRAKGDITAHAETEAIRLAVQTTQAGPLSDATLYTSREPCLLCAYVIRHYRIGQVVYAERGGQTGSVHGAYPLLLTEQIGTWGPPPRVVGYDLVEILDYLPGHQPVFQALNEAWICEHFRLDPVDVAVLSNPEEHILRNGGRLFMARYNGRLVGTCGLLRVEASRFEFTRMAVERAYRGKGLGKALALHALSVARLLDVHDTSSVTVVSEATLASLREAMPFIGLEQMRLRFRANIEIAGVPPYWEEHLFGEPGKGVLFRAREVTLLGMRPRARCNVPPRNPFTGETDKQFVKRMVSSHQESLPAWSRLEAFGGYYSLTVDTFIPDTERGKCIRLGGPVKILAPVELPL